MNCREGIKGLESDDIFIAEFGEACDVSEGDFRERLLRISPPIETNHQQQFSIFKLRLHSLQTILAMIHHRLTHFSPILSTKQTIV
jgi:hypothetical protein